MTAQERAIEATTGGVNIWAISIPIAACAAMKAPLGTRSSSRPLTDAAMATTSGAISHGAGTPRCASAYAPPAAAATSAIHSTALPRRHETVRPRAPPAGFACAYGIIVVS